MVLVVGLATGLTGAARAQGLSVWTTFQGSSMRWLEDQATTFTSAFGVPVELKYFDVAELRLQASLHAEDGEAADLFVGVPHDQVTALAVSGILADLSSYATPAYLADLNAAARAAYTFDDALFGLPMLLDGPALVVNKELLPSLPATYEAFLDAATQLTDGDTYGFEFDIENLYFAYAWLHTYGGYVFGRHGGSLDPDDIGLANDGAVRGAEALRDLRYERALIPDGTDYGTANERFLQGSLAMIYTGPWSIGAYRAAGIDIAVAAMPPLADGTPWSGFMGVQGVLMNQFSKAKTDAANLAKWLTREDALIELSEASGRPPASKAALEGVQDDPVIAGFGAALSDSEPIPNVPEMGRVWGPMARALGTILASPDSDVPAALRGAVADIRAP